MNETIGIGVSRIEERVAAGEGGGDFLREGHEDVLPHFLTPRPPLPKIKTKGIFWRGVGGEDYFAILCPAVNIHFTSIVAASITNA